MATGVVTVLSGYPSGHISPCGHILQFFRQSTPSTSRLSSGSLSGPFSLRRSPDSILKARMGAFPGHFLHTRHLPLCAEITEGLCPPPSCDLLKGKDQVSGTFALCYPARCLHRVGPHKHAISVTGHEQEGDGWSCQAAPCALAVPAWLLPQAWGWPVTNLGQVQEGRERNEPLSFAA